MRVSRKACKCDYQNDIKKKPSGCSVVLVFFFMVCLVIYIILDTGTSKSPTNTTISRNIQTTDTKQPSPSPSTQTRKQKQTVDCNNWNSISFEEQLKCAENRCIAHDGGVPAAESAILHFRYNNGLSVNGFKVVLTANTLQHPELFEGARTTDQRKGFMTCLQYKIKGQQNQNACVYINLQTCNAYEIQIGDKLYPYH